MKKISEAAGRAALAAWRAADAAGAADGAGVAGAAGLATAVRYSLQELAARHPGQAVEVRVPPLGAVQILGGTTHRRGTPPAVVECAALTWLRLVCGDLRWDEAVAAGLVSASGQRTDLSAVLPLGF